MDPIDTTIERGSLILMSEQILVIKETFEKAVNKTGFEWYDFIERVLNPLIDFFLENTPPFWANDSMFMEWIPSIKLEQWAQFIMGDERMWIL